MPRVVACVLATTLMAPPAAAGPALSATGELLTGAGYDTNVLYDLALDPLTPTYGSTPDAFALVEPRLLGTLAIDGLRLDAHYDAGIRATTTNGLLVLQEASLVVRSPEFGRMRAHLGASGSRFDASALDAHRFYGASGYAGLALRLGDEVRLSSQYRLAGRRYPDPTREKDGLAAREVAHGPAVRLAFVPRPTIEISAIAGLVALRTDLPGANLDRWRVDLDARFHPGHRVTASASGWLALLRSRPDGSDTQWGGEIGILMRATDRVDLVASYSALVDLFAGAPGGEWRHVALLGVRAHATTGVAGGKSPGKEPEVRDGKAHFRLHAPSAARVTVMGSWNDWKEQPLVPSSEHETWEAWVEIGSGSHRYRFMVDGRPVAPPDAPNTRPDGFGGQDAVLEVP